MAGRVDPSRDLRLGLQALESGAIDREQLVSAVGAWARSPDRTLAEVLNDRGALDASTLARLEDRVTRDLELLGGSPGVDRTVEAPTPERSARPGNPDATASFAGPPLGGVAAAGPARA